MSLIAYEFKTAEHSAEIKQFRATLPILYEHYQGRDEVVLYLGGRLNINGVDIDGLIIKSDAIILVEFKNYSGDIKVRVNGDWFHGDKRINGGSKKPDGTFKTVFEQLKINRRNLTEGLSHYIKNKNAYKNIQAVVVFTKIENLDMDKEFTWGENAWVNVTDIEHLGEELDTIKATARWTNESIAISNDEIFDFIREKKCDERYILMKYSDVHILPSDLFHEDETHNGDDFSPNTILAQLKAENQNLGAEKQKLEAEMQELQSLNTEMFQGILEKIGIIIQDQDNLKNQMEEIQRSKDTLSVQNSQINGNSNPLSEQRLSSSTEETNSEKKETTSDYDDTLNGVTIPSTKKRFGMKQSVLKTFDVEYTTLDDDQIDIIEMTLDRSLIVAGCAGSGKSIIAMHKAQQIDDLGEDVILIAYTKSLNRYMKQGLKKIFDQKFYYHWQWINDGKPKADYIIVDEIQDFTKDEILDFINATKKSFFFFGDTAQSIYNINKKTMAIEDISKLTGIDITYLYNNYRLPKPVAKITQDYIGLSEDEDSVRKYSEEVYLSKENKLPIFMCCDSKEQQIEQIISIINDNKYKNVGILVPNNDIIISTMRAFDDANFSCELKYNDGYNSPNNRDTLDFKTSKPKLMTYHSAKGLQFETVIIPFYNGANDVNEKKALYVAMTRTYRNLYILYSDFLLEPLNEVPKRLYTQM